MLQPCPRKYIPYGSSSLYLGISHCLFTLSNNALVINKCLSTISLQNKKYKELVQLRSSWDQKQKDTGSSSNKENLTLKVKRYFSSTKNQAVSLCRYLRWGRKHCQSMRKELLCHLDEQGGEARKSGIYSAPEIGTLN